MKKLGFLVVLLILYIYHPWFFIDKTLSSGDFPYLFLENIKEFSFLPSPPFLWLVPYYQSGAKIMVEYLGLTWNLAEKILWFWPFLILSIASSFYFTRSWIGVLIYTTSTYPLMLVGGGQMGVALAYSLAPLVLATFIKLIDNFVLLTQNFKFPISNFQFPIGIGLVLGIQMMFDPRIVYITMIAVIIYFFVRVLSSKKIIVKNSFLILVPIFISVIFNIFWIVPLLKFGFPKGLDGHTSLLGFQFLSFADFSHSLSALHPNWPENIFGKIYFMRPEFIMLPILAYSSLIFLNKSKIKYQISKINIKNQKFGSNEAMKQLSNDKILFFGLLGLIGAFLAKGANPPFGFVNEFLFQNFPGMNMFRDATKFYLLTLLSYSILIPYAVMSIYERLKFLTEFSIFKIQFSIKSKIFNFQNLFIIFTISYLMFLIRPAVMGELGGTFKPRNVPREYIQFKDFINDQKEPFKTLWIPQRQRFGFSSLAHPALSSVSLNKEEVKADSIKYIIVPFDSEKEIFMEDRKYSEEKRTKLIQGLESLPWLQKIPGFGDLAVFEVK